MTEEQQQLSMELVCIEHMVRPLVATPANSHTQGFDPQEFELKIEDEDEA
jgi:hypothetical protein